MPKDTNDTLSIMEKLQPIAFLFSMTLLIATLVHTLSKSSELSSILMTSVSFFFAYLGFFAFKKTAFTFFRFFGEGSLLFALFFIMTPLKEFVNKIDEAKNPINTWLIFFFFGFFFFGIILYLLETVKKDMFLNPKHEDYIHEGYSGERLSEERLYFLILGYLVGSALTLIASLFLA